MAAFAVMTVDWAGQRRSYLDNFLNYALSVIPSDSPQAISRETVRPLIIERFNLSLPSNIVQQLLKRAEKLGYLESIDDRGVRLTEKGKREVAPIPYTLTKLAKEQQLLAEKFVEWALAELGIALARDLATSMLLDYVETYYCALMALSDGSGSAQLKLPKIEPSPEQKIAAGFVASIAESDSDLFESLANMARGSMMVSALYAPTLVDTTRGFRHTTIYLDTKIVLRALGYEGEPAEQSTIEFLQLLNRQGARTAIFEFTLREIRAVIDAVGQKARTGSMWMARPGSVESFFYKLNASNAVIEQHSVRVESKIGGLGLFVDANPPYDNHAFVIDESEVEKDLLAGNPNYRATALKHDVELIAAVVRARAGRARASLEESRATFVTMNTLVVSTARAAQKRANEVWPLVMFETDVVALTWVKEPLAAPNLPKQLLLATSLGLTNPGRQDWSMYIGELGRLLENSEISDNDLVLLRQRYEMNRLAFVHPPGQERDGDKRTQIRVSIETARDAITAELTAPIRAEAQANSTRIEELESTVDDERSRSDARKMEADRLLTVVLKPTWRNGTALKWLVIGAILLVAAGAILMTFVPESTAALQKIPLGGAVLWAIRLIAAVAALTGGFTGPVFKLGVTVRRRFILHELNRLNVDPGRASEVGFDVVAPPKG